MTPGSDEGGSAPPSMLEKRTSSSSARQLRWAAFASGVATQLGEEEQAERSKRRQWAAAAAQTEQDRSILLANLSGEVERWAAAEHRRLQPLQAHVWRALRGVAADAQVLWPGVRVELFGSWASGLQLSSSDVDLLVCDLPAIPAAPAILLRRLATQLSNGTLNLTSIKMIETARVPVIKASLTLPDDAAALSGGPLQLDISLEATSHSGVASTSLTRDVFCRHLSGLQELVLLLKQLLSTRSLNCAATGGLGSYALVLMAASLLQQQAALDVPQGVGGSLVRFLEYFSALPETTNALHAVVLDSASRLQPKLATRSQLAASKTASSGHDPDGDTDALYEEAVYASSLLVQDPLSPKFSNVSQTAFRWGLVQSCFREALQRLQKALHEADKNVDDGVLLAALLGGSECLS